MKFSLSRPITFISLSMLMLSGCSALMGSLRQDFRDPQAQDNPEPVTGGQWAEHRFLDEDPPENGGGHYSAVGHSERSPASGGSMAPSWMSAEEADESRRDSFRQSPQSDNPVSSGEASEVDPPTRRQYQGRTTREDFVDSSPNEGSLWASGGQTNYYFTKNKVRSIGDIVSINMEAGMIRDIGLEVKRTLSDNEKEAELAIAQERIKQKALGGGDSVATSQAAPGTAPASTPAATPTPNSTDIPQATPADVDVSKSLDVKAGDIMMAEIVERYANGNYKIRGVKKIPYKNGAARLVSVVGVARASDIGEDDVIASGKLYEYRIESSR